MADTWLDYTGFKQQYPDSDLTEQRYARLAASAAMLIEEHTHWRAAVADDPETLAILANCQGVLVDRIAGWPAAHASARGVSSASNDGYSESYISGADLRAEQAAEVETIMRQTLGHPDASWMTYRGGVYHPRGRR